MPTPNLNLPLIDRNMFADVPRDMNALAYAVDDAVGPNGKIALRQDLQSLQQSLNNHINDNTKHLTPVERAGWNQAVADLGDKNALVTKNKGNLVLAINELFQSSSDKNAKIAAAITVKGVPTSPTATGDQMAANVLAIETGKFFTELIPTPPITSNQVNVQVLTTLLDFKPDYIMTDWGGVVYENGWNRGPAALDFQYVSGFGLIPEDGKWRIRVSLGNTKTTTHPASTVTVFAFKVS